MRKFRFRLATLLKLREHTERMRQKDHALALGKVHEQQAHLALLESRRGSTTDYQKGSLEGKLSLVSLQTASRYLVRLRGEKMSGIETLRGLNMVAEKERVRLVEASREREKYRRLKEKQQERHYDRESKRETEEAADSLMASFTHQQLSNATS
ncbi:MAG: flagellar FliJ family protein [candidate division Zixibacteria bacterium]